MDTPTKIKRLETNGLEIHWSNGVIDCISSRTLRTHCPSADSRVKRGELNHDRPLSPKPGGLKSLHVVTHSVDESLSLEKIWAIGNYAIGIKWGDGHDTGIYSFELLKKIARRIPQEKSVA